MPTTLSNAAGSVEDFLIEADKCASSECGFMAMLGIFAVMAALSEALAGRALPTPRLFRMFVNDMDDLSSWLDSPPSVSPTRERISDLLADLRHALVHQLSLPSGVILVDKLADARLLRQRNPGLYIVGISELVVAVRRTASAIIAAQPDAVIDPRPGRRTRGTGRTYVVKERE